MASIAWTAIGLLGVCVFGMFSMFYYLAARIDTRIEAQGGIINELGVTIGARLDAFGARLDAFGARLDAFGARLDLQGATLSARIDHLAERLDAQLHWHTK